MDVTSLPFNRLIELEAGSPESGFLVSIPVVRRVEVKFRRPTRGRVSARGWQQGFKSLKV
jgi:hypothetical protein